jgi:TetR/AcrR family transcriptional repressor of nem operon
LPRPRQFDEDAVLDAAIQRFWQQGYTRTSVRELAADMQITGASLYNAFGDKRKLFITALRRYVENHSLRGLAAVAAADDPVAALRQFLDEIVEDAVATGRGCLLMSSAAELSDEDLTIFDEVRRHLAKVEMALQRIFASAQGKSLVPESLDCADRARSVLSVIVSLQVLARTRSDPAVLRSIARSALAHLDGR